MITTTDHHPALPAPPGTWAVTLVAGVELVEVEVHALVGWERDHDEVWRALVATDTGLARLGALADSWRIVHAPTEIAGAIGPLLRDELDRAVAEAAAHGARYVLPDAAEGDVVAQARRNLAADGPCRWSGLVLHGRGTWNCPTDESELDADDAERIAAQLTHGCEVFYGPTAARLLGTEAGRFTAAA